MDIEKKLDENDVIVSTTDLKGIILYANKVFCDMCEYSVEELYGQPHNIIRDPSVPKAIFKFLWDNLHQGNTVIAYVKNRAKDKNKFYWVKAIVVPVFRDGKIVQFTSYRTKPSQFAIDQVETIYSIVSEYEKNHTIEQSLQLIYDFLEARGLTYEQFINKLSNSQQVLNEKLLSIDINQLKIDHILFRSRIQSFVQKGYENVDVVKPCCCDFGKKLASLENEEFSQDSRFKDVQRLHIDVHNLMEEYVRDYKTQGDIILQKVQRDIDKIFNILTDLIDNYK